MGQEQKEAFEQVGRVGTRAKIQWRERAAMVYLPEHLEIVQALQRSLLPVAKAGEEEVYQVQVPKVANHDPRNRNGLSFAYNSETAGKSHSNMSSHSR